MRTIHVGLIGLGNVGGGVATILAQQADLLEQRLGARLGIEARGAAAPGARLRGAVVSFTGNGRRIGRDS